MTICGRQHFYSTRSQVLMLVYFALHRTGGGTRQDTVDFINREQWWQHAPEDYRPYPYAGTQEACWRILVAFGRMELWQLKPERHLQKFDENNHWKLNRLGEEEFARVLGEFKAGRGNVSKGYLWTPIFKKLLDPNHIPSAGDVPRPKTIYSDFEERLRIAAARADAVAFLDAI